MSTKYTTDRVVSEEIKPTIDVEEIINRGNAAKKGAITDTTHSDRAVEILAAYSGDREWTAEEDKKLVRKIDRRLISILFITYGIQFYDKSLLSQAALFGLRQDLNLTANDKYSFSSSIFYIGFIAGTYPAALMAQRWPIERVAFGIVLLWGICLTLTIKCTNYQTLYTQRFFLGLLEAGVSPMFMMIVGSWYKKDEQAFRIGAWYSATGFVSCLSPLINWGLGHIQGGVLHPWQYMYLVAGCVTIAWAFILLFFLPSDPTLARGLTDRERFITISRLVKNNTGVRSTHFKWNEAWELFFDIKFWIVVTIAFLTMITNGPVTTFVPIFISGFGFSQFNSLLLVIPLSFLSGLGQLLSTFLAAKVPDSRSYIMAFCQIGPIVGALLSWNLPRSEKGGLLFATYILVGYASTYAVLMGLQLANTAGYTKRSLASAGIFLGYCLGNFVGPMVFRDSDAPVYQPGFVTVLSCSVSAALLSLLYRFLCVRENRLRDAAGMLEAFDHAYDDGLTDKKNNQFRYSL